MRRTLSTLVCVLAASSVTAQTPAAANQEIRAQITALQSAFNKADPAGMAALYAPDGDAMINDGPYVVGSAGLLKAGRDDVSARPKGLQISITVTNVRMLTADVALANTRAHFNLAEVKDDRGTFVFVRREGKWLIAGARVQAAQKQ